jgi:DNA-binding NarL/FixJ family response regulator
MFDSRYSTLIPLPPIGTLEPRLVLWRQRGNFTDRDQLLLNLLRPHLAELHVESRTRDRRNQLTTRQTQLLALVAQGMTNRQIASRLQVSEGTVRTHFENIFERLGVNSRAAAVARAATIPTLSAASN